MNNFNEKFDKIFVISLKNNRERQNYIEKSLNKYNIKFEFFITEKPNIENINILEKEYNLEIIDYNKVNYGCIGCFNSHLKIWKQIIDNSWNNVLIFEDNFESVIFSWIMTSSNNNTT